MNQREKYHKALKKSLEHIADPNFRRMEKQGAEDFTELLSKAHKDIEIKDGKPLGSIRYKRVPK